VSLLEDIQAAVGEGFEALGDLKTTVSYVAPGTRTYDPATGDFSGTETLTSLSAVLTDYSDRELAQSGAVGQSSSGRDVRPEDRKVIFEAAEAPSLTPTNAGKIRIGSDDWSIISVRQDPALATWTLQIRRS